MDSGLRTLVEAEKMMQIAFLLPSAAFVGWLGGLGLDHLFHTGWIETVGIVFGGFAGLFYVVRLVIATKPSQAGKGGAGSSAPNAGKNEEKREER